MIRVILFVVAVSMAGCSKNKATDPNGGGDGGTTHDAAFYVELGWESYDAGDYIDARSQFERAVSQDSTYAPAISGGAWTSIELGYTGFAQGEFERAIAESSSYIPAHCGRAVTSHAEALNIPQLAAERLPVTVEAASNVLQLGGESWQFDRISTINARHMRVLLALTYYELGQYADAQSQIDILDPGNGLDPGDPDYARLLLIEIENERDQI